MLNVKIIKMLNKPPINSGYDGVLEVIIPPGVVTYLCRKCRDETEYKIMGKSVQECRGIYCKDD